jgi:hypothetical protein
MKNGLNVLESGICVQKIAAFGCFMPARTMTRTQWYELYRGARAEKLVNVLIDSYTHKVSGTMLYGCRHSRYLPGTVDHNAAIGPKLHILDSDNNDITDRMRINWYYKGIRTDKELYNAILCHYAGYTVKDTEGNTQKIVFDNGLMYTERDKPLYTLYWK